MGLKELEAAIAQLSRRRRTATQVAGLADAAGRPIKPAEDARLRRLLADEADKFAPPGLRALASLVGETVAIAGSGGPADRAAADPATATHLAAPDLGDAAAPASQPADRARARARQPGWTITRRIKTDAVEASGLVAYAGGFFIAGDGERPLSWCRPKPDAKRAKTRRVASGPLSGVEGITRAGDVLFAIEETGGLWSIPIAGPRELGPPTQVGTLPRVGRRKNKGYEGISTLPPRLRALGLGSGGPSSSSPPALIVAHERAPRALYIVTLDPFAIEQEIHVPRRVRDLLADFADIATCPATGHLMLLSDQSRRLVECSVQSVRHGSTRYQHSLVVLGQTRLPPLPKKKRKKGRRLQPEGASFDDDGRLWVIGEGDSVLLSLERI